MTTKGKQTSTKEPEKTAADMGNQAMKNYEQAMRTGLKMQEEAVKWWSGMFSQAATGQEWQKRVHDLTGIATGIMPLAQKRMEEMLDFIEKNGRTNSELMKKAVEAAQTPVLADSQAKWLDFWTSSMGAMRKNMEALTEINTKAIDSWLSFVRQNTELTEIRVPKTA